METTGRITAHQRIIAQPAEKKLDLLLARLAKKLPVWEESARKISGEIDSLALNGTILFWRLGRLRVARGEIVGLMKRIAVSLRVSGKSVSLDLVPLPRIAALVSQINRIDRVVTSINEKSRAPEADREEAGTSTRRLIPDQLDLAHNPIGSPRYSDQFLAGPDNDSTMAYLRKLSS
jgi:hypothetical protein